MAATATKPKTEKRKKKKINVVIVKETFGEIPIEEALRQAFEPYFNPE